MFIWAVCPTTVEMDLTFVSEVRINRSYLPYKRRTASIGPSVRGGPMDEAEALGDMNVRRTGPLDLDRDVDFDSLCRMEVWVI